MKGSVRGSDAPRRLLLLDPLAILALLLMIVNDRWLKCIWHNEVTGKLSDVAVCFVLPLFFADLSVACTRWVSRQRLLNIAAGTTAMLYTVLELSSGVAQWTCDALHAFGPWIGIHRPFTMTRDPSDLAALVAILPAIARGRQRMSPRTKRKTPMLPSNAPLISAVLAMCLFASAREAQALPFELRRSCTTNPVQLAPQETRCNDGFFIRASGYLATMQTHLRRVEADGAETWEQQLTVQSFLPGFDVTFGGTPMRGLLLGGFVGYARTEVAERSLTESGSAEPGVTYQSGGMKGRFSRFVLGPSISIFPVPDWGWVFDIKPTIGGIDIARYDSSPATYGLQLGIAYELWATANLGVGVTLRAEWSRLRENLAVKRGPDFTEGSFNAIGFGFSATMH